MDVLVAGGGVAGVYAALGAADHGAGVLLVEQHGFVGGQGTAGGVHTFCGETRFVNDRWREMLRRLDAFGGIARYRPNADGRAFDCESLKFVLQEMLAEAGVELLLHTQVLAVERSGERGGDRVAGVVLANKSGLTRVAPGVAVDATGDADLVARGGWPFRKGGPVLMPGDPPTVDEAAGRLQLPMSLYFTLVDNGAPVQPQLPPGCPRYGDDEAVPMITVIPHGHHVTVKMKVIGHDATDGASLSAAEQAGRRQMMGVVHYLQTIGYRGKRFPNHRLAWVAPHIGIREGRRVEALYSLCADDILAGRHFPDAVAVGSYHTDYHWPTVVQRAGTGITVQCPPHQIPLRAMRPRGAANLLVPGRCLGGDHLATSSFRVMGTCAQTGFAAGVTAALAAPSGSVDAVSVPAVRARLRQAGVRLDLAPYYSYLRRRRGYDEHAGTAPGPVTGLAVAELPTGEVLLAYASGGEVGVLRRYEERWQPAAEPARGMLADPDGAAAASAGAEVALAVHDAERNRIEGLEQAAAMAEEVRESDAPPGVELHAAGVRWLSCDGGATWHTRSAAPNGDVAGACADTRADDPAPPDNSASAAGRSAAAGGKAGSPGGALGSRGPGTGSGSGRDVDAASNFGGQAGAGSNGHGAAGAAPGGTAVSGTAEPEGTGRRGHTTGIDAGLPVPPVPGAAVAALTLTEDDRATFGMRRLYAAAWANFQGVVIGTSTGAGSWRETLIAVPGGRGPCALTATADGVLLACTDGTAIRCHRASLDALIGDGEHAEADAANWHHDSADLIATLRERQPVPSQ